jgi:hypothetical protein
VGLKAQLALQDQREIQGHKGLPALALPLAILLQILKRVVVPQFLHKSLYPGWGLADLPMPVGLLT